MTSDKDYYAVLDINPHADRRAIAEAYERLARRYQPDHNAPPTDPQRMREIDEAFDVLDDPERRAQYDRLRARPLTAGDITATSSGAGWVPVAEATAGVADPRRPLAHYAGPLLVGLSGLAFLAGAAVLFYVALSGSDERTVTLASGLKYVDTQEGSGDQPHPGDKLVAHYTGRLEDGTEFDTSRDGNPLLFTLGAGELIEGWDPGFATMREGGKRKLIIPPDLAYGPEGGGPIPPNATITFDVELLEVMPLGQEIATGSGLRYIDLEAPPTPGQAETPKEGDEVVVHLTGIFPNGIRFFDTLTDTGAPYSFILGSPSEIRGFDEGVSTMKVGSLRRLFIPPELGYGDQVEQFTVGDFQITIEPNTPLIFEVKLIRIEDPSAQGQ